MDALAVPGVQLCARNSLRWVFGMEIEWEPDDLGAEPAPQPLGRGLADAAERSEVVGPDDDAVLAHAGASCASTAGSLTISRRGRVGRSMTTAATTATPSHCDQRSSAPNAT